MTTASAGTTSSAARTDARRVAPPETTACEPSGSTIVCARSSAPGGAATTTSDTPGHPSAAPTACASKGRPASSTNAFGRSCPRRRPVPAASTTATAPSTGPSLLEVREHHPAGRGLDHVAHDHRHLGAHAFAGGLHDDHRAVVEVADRLPRLAPPPPPADRGERADP